MVRLKAVPWVIVSAIVLVLISRKSDLVVC
jgi:hypothetical protein